MLFYPGNSGKLVVLVVHCRKYSMAKKGRRTLQADTTSHSKERWIFVLCRRLTLISKPNNCGCDVPTIQRACYWCVNGVGCMYSPLAWLYNNGTTVLSAAVVIDRFWNLREYRKCLAFKLRQIWWKTCSYWQVIWWINLSSSKAYNV